MSSISTAPYTISNLVKTMIKTSFKKILPSILIIAVLATGIFSSFGVSVVEAESVFTKEKDLERAINPAGAFLEDYKKAVADKNDAERQAKSKKDVFDDPEDADESITGCSLWPHKFNAWRCTKFLIAYMGAMWLSLMGWVVWLSGNLLEMTINYTVLHIGQKDAGIPFIQEGWKIFRDVANIFIIFALLFIGIVTTLRIEKYNIKKLLSGLIVVALFINFSLFFTTAIVDSSNLLATEFHQQTIKSVNKESKKQIGSIGGAYMSALKLQSVYSKGPTNYAYAQTLTNLGLHQIFIVTIMGSILYIITAFSFFAVAFILINRYIVLIFLMILSPLAFVGMILPNTQSYAGMWWQNLFKYAFYAPIYFLMSFVVIRIILSDSFKASIGLKKDSVMTFAGMIDGDVGNIALILNFILVIGLLLASIFVAQTLGLRGSSTVINLGKSVRKFGQGYIGRKTIGFGGSKAVAAIERKQKELNERKSDQGQLAGILKKWAISPALKVAKRAAVGASRSKFQSSSSSVDVEQARSKDIEREVQMRANNPKQLAGYFLALQKSAQNKTFKNMSTTDQSSLIRELKEGKETKLVEKLLGSLSEEQGNDIQEADNKFFGTKIKAALKTKREGEEGPDLTEIVEEMEKLEVSLGNMEAGLLKKPELVKHLKERDVNNINYRSDLSGKDAKVIINNVMRSNNKEAQEAIKKSSVLSRLSSEEEHSDFLERMLEQGKTIGKNA